ncbi:MAG: hypothetical protein HBSIN02_25010 [Bacteroidia bacterium]|nr:MAG: hypothetical protein HBSIN02_25010 [Bacteroidia bacterium]
MLPRSIVGLTAMIQRYSIPNHKLAGIAQDMMKTTNKLSRGGEAKILEQLQATVLNRIPVTSSTVASVGYDPATLTLEVEFTNGTIYQYFDVPEMEYQNLVGAESVGKHLNNNIKPNYRYTKT